VDRTNHNVARESSSQHRASGLVDGGDDGEHHSKIGKISRQLPRKSTTTASRLLTNNIVIFPGIKSKPWKFDNILLAGSISSTVENLLYYHRDNVAFIFFSFTWILISCLFSCSLSNVGKCDLWYDDPFDYFRVSLKLCCSGYRPRCAALQELPNIRHTLVDGNLVRGPAATQGTQCGRAGQEM
jgi:hypothetical protein